MSSADDFALVLDANGVELRLQKVGALTPSSFTWLGWQVAQYPVGGGGVASPS